MTILKIENSETVIGAMKGSDLAIYGFGFLGKWVYEFFKNKFNYTATIYDKRELSTPEGFCNNLQDLKSFKGVIIICSRHYVEEVGELMTSLGIRWISADAFFLEITSGDREMIVNSFSHDNLSLKTYFALEKILASGLMIENSHLVKDQYFHPPEFHATFNESFIDAGAFTGDTLEKFIQENLGTFESIYAFEPGDRQFGALKSRVSRLISEWAISYNKIHLIKKGLGHNRSSALFDEKSEDAMSHSATLGGGSEGGKIEIVSIDDELADVNISFIKSDIEGMDLPMLKGAEKTIIKNRPKLAISCYHYPTDLVEMVKFINGLKLNYKFKLRHHANVIGDYVLYAY
jgi:FkbM family methyltransferase